MLDIYTPLSLTAARLLDGWFSVYFRWDPVGYAQVGELYELGGPAVESEGLVDVVFPDDALGVVVLEPSFPDVGQLDIHCRHWAYLHLSARATFKHILFRC